ncbi:Fe-S cluster assembly protein SufD, partial [Actinoplanes philippinensis]
MTTEAIAPPSTKSQVLRSFDVTDFPALDGLEEEWRFTPLKRLRDLVTATSLSGAAPSVEHGDLPAGVTVSDA